jgi:hypothetical protein
MAAKFGFTLPPLGGPPESVILMKCQTHRDYVNALPKLRKLPDLEELRFDSNIIQ